MQNAALDRLRLWLAGDDPRLALGAAIGIALLAGLVTGALFGWLGPALALGAIGGLATGLLEMANAAKVGLYIEAERVPVLPECRIFCGALGLDPLGLIASGSLLATVSPEEVGSLSQALAREGIVAQEIGRVTPQEEGLRLKTRDGVRELPMFERDELARFLAAMPG